MSDLPPRDQLGTALDAIRALLARAVNNQEVSTDVERAIHDLERQRTETTSGLLGYAATSTTLTQRQTDMAQERTALSREQTRLSTRSTELATIRTDLSRERSTLAGQRTDLAVIRTDMSRARTNLADQRTSMASARTRFSKRRTELAQSRTTLSSLRTELARGRTYLALTRTGLAFFTLGVALFRYFGLSWWSLFDTALVLGSLAGTAVGLRGYLRATKASERLQVTLPVEVSGSLEDIEP